MAAAIQKHAEREMKVATPQFEIDQINATLHGENVDYLRHVLAFNVAWCIVKYHDPDLLKQMPDWVGDMVREICQMYLEHGSYGIVSNVGEVDHTAMVAELTRILGLAPAEPSGSSL